MAGYTVEIKVVRDDGDGAHEQGVVHVEADTAAEALLKVVDQAKAEWTARGDVVRDPSG